MADGRMCSFAPDLLAVVQGIATRYSQCQSSDDAEFIANVQELIDEKVLPEEPEMLKQWQRASQAKKTHTSHAPDRRQGKKHGAVSNKPPLVRQFNFDAAKTMQDDVKLMEVQLDKNAIDVDKILESKNTFTLKGAKDAEEEEEEELKKSWKFTIPHTCFANPELEDWGRLRDVQVKFEPGRIVVEAHDRSGNTKIIHCSSIPKKVDTESSTYKLDPEGRGVHLNLEFKNSPRKSGDDIMEKPIKPQPEKKKVLESAPATLRQFL